MNHKPVAIGTDGHGNVQDLGVIQRLLYSGTDGMIIVFGFYNRNGDIGFLVKDEIGAFALAAPGFLAFYEDAAICEENFFADLAVAVPAGFNYGGQYELSADVAFGKGFL